MIITLDTFCTWMQHEMNKADLNAAQVARLSGLTPCTVRGLMAGRQFPTLDTMQKLAGVFKRQIIIV